MSRKSGSIDAGEWVVIILGSVFMLYVLSILLEYGPQGAPDNEYEFTDIGIVVSDDGRILRTPEGKVLRDPFNGVPFNHNVRKYIVEQEGGGEITVERYTSKNLAVEAAPGRVTISTRILGLWIPAEIELK